MHWYAISVKHQHERAIESVLHARQFETLVPMYRSQRTWSDRTKEIELPLFAGYVMCRFDAGHTEEVLTVPGVRSLVGFGGLPGRIEDRQIADIRAIAASGLGLRPWPFLKTGDRVRVERGPLRGIEGTLLEDKHHTRLVVGVDLMQ